MFQNFNQCRMLIYCQNNDVRDTSVCHRFYRSFSFLRSKFNWQQWMKAFSQHRRTGEIIKVPDWGTENPDRQGNSRPTLFFSYGIRIGTAYWAQADTSWNTIPEEAHWNREEICLVNEWCHAQWNKLPETVVIAESVNIFKNRLERCEEWSN